MRAGFSLVEAVVALLLLQVGMLAVVSVTAVAARDLATAQRIARAQMLARSRVELLRGQACAGPAAGADSAAGFAEQWRVQADGRACEIVASVVFRRADGRFARVVYRAWVVRAP